ncbi:MAG: hypothetical protein E6K96_05445 [Thaumarchaeota archaeon]|nr:MAG: hypothetical protein E6K96_05445 [Nitrososphaerota archaeon]
MEQPRLDADAANFRLTIITSFLLGATMLSLDVSIIRQSAATGLMGTAEWLLAVSIALMLFSTLIMLFMSYVTLVTMYLAPFTQNEKFRMIARVRNYVGLSSVLIITSFGSTFLVSLGLSSPWSWLLGGIGYGSGILWALYERLLSSQVLGFQAPIIPELIACRADPPTSP